MRERRLNPQGLARRDPLLMRTLRSSIGHTTVSIDLSSGEPSVTSHFSQDPMYRYAVLDGIGKAPFYKDGVLMIDSIYLMCASFSPIHGEEMRAAFDAKWPAGSFIDQWLVDPDHVKSSLKPLYPFNKMSQLGFGYNMGPKKFVRQSYDQGFDISLKHAKQFYSRYWQVFSGVRAFADRCAAQVERDGYIVNPFGYRCTPDPHKSFNAFIQSAVSGIMHVFLMFLAEEAPYMKLITVIHDEILCDVPTSTIEQFRAAKEVATRRLNDALGWTVAIRTGFVTGQNFYESK